MFIKTNLCGKQIITESYLSNLLRRQTFSLKEARLLLVELATLLHKLYYAHFKVFDIESNNNK